MNAPSFWASGQKDPSDEAVYQPSVHVQTRGVHMWKGIATKGEKGGGGRKAHMLLPAACPRGGPTNPL